MLIFEYPFWIISIDQCIKQKIVIDIKIHRNYQTEIIPYCSGRWSRTLVGVGFTKDDNGSLNPYCSGQWSRTNLRLDLMMIMRLGILLIVSKKLELKEVN
mgnify:CR=1 FL=1